MRARFEQTALLVPQGTDERTIVLRENAEAAATFKKRLFGTLFGRKEP